MADDAGTCAACGHPRHPAGGCTVIVQDARRRLEGPPESSYCGCQAAAHSPALCTDPETCPLCLQALRQELATAAEALWSSREALRRANAFPAAAVGLQADTEPSKARAWTLAYVHEQALRLHFMVRTVLLSLAVPRVGPTPGATFPLTEDGIRAWAADEVRGYPDCPGEVAFHAADGDVALEEIRAAATSFRAASMAPSELEAFPRRVQQAADGYAQLLAAITAGPPTRNLWAELASLAGVTPEEISRCRAKHGDGVVGLVLWALGSAHREVHDCGRTDGRPLALTQAERWERAVRAAWTRMHEEAARG